jgi:hypothetical protein
MAYPTIYAEIQVVYAVFSAAIPAVNRWLRKFDTKMGGGWTGTTNASDSSDALAGGRSESRKQSLPLTNANSQTAERLSPPLSSEENPQQHDLGISCGTDVNFRPETA